MNVYVESSAVLRWLFAEDLGEAVRLTLSAAEKVVASRLTLIEVRRVIRRGEYEGRLNAVQSVDLMTLLAQAASTWAILEISGEVAHRAEAGFPLEPVRTLDAIHIASALFVRRSLPDLTVVSTDHRIRTNAQQLGLPIKP